MTNFKLVEDCEMAYTELSSKVFGNEQSGKSFHYNVKVLEENIEKVLHKAGEIHETKLFDDRSDCCKTFTTMLTFPVLSLQKLSK